jgi:hypothetical protein
MTVIAWDGTTLAADKRAVSGGGISRTCTKIWPYKDMLLGISGDWDIGAEVREWFKAGAEPEKFPKIALEDKATFIVIGADGIRHYCRGPYPMWIEARCCAWGAGRDFAEAAMYLGRDAYKAIEVACHFQSDCGNGIDTLQLRRMP